MPSATLIKMSDAIVRRLPFAKSAADARTYKDEACRPLILRVGVAIKVFRVESEYRRKGERVGVHDRLGEFPGMSYQQARRAVTEKLGDVAGGKRKAGVRQGLRLGVAMAEYIAHIRKEAKLNGKGVHWAHECERTYQRLMLHWSDTSLAELSRDPKSVREWHTRIKAPAVADAAAALLRACYNHAGKENDLPLGLPTRSVAWNRLNTRPGREKRATVAAIPLARFPQFKSEVDALAKVNPSRGAYQILCLYLGARPIELARLKQGDIDFEKHTVTFRNNKMKRDVVVPMSPEIESHFRIAMAARAEWLLYPSCDYVFPAASESGHLVNWRQNAGAELTWFGYAGRYSFRGVAEILGCPERVSRQLMSHTTSNVHSGYLAHESAMLSASEWQLKISAKISALMNGDALV